MADKEYIEREKAYELARTSDYYSDFHKSIADLTSLKELLEDTPAADVVEVKHGEWIYCPETINLRSHFYCSVCNDIQLEHYVKNSFEYCPNCGARMDGKGD